MGIDGLPGAEKGVLMATFELLTNEWLRADGNKWIGRKVLCHFNDGYEEPLIFNGYYWNDQKGHRVVETVNHRVTHFYIYEKFNENDIL